VPALYQDKFGGIVAGRAPGVKMVGMVEVGHQLVWMESLHSTELSVVLPIYKWKCDPMGNGVGELYLV